MSDLKATFSFYKAGQGAFYGGKIESKRLNKTWTAVYDCGTSSFISGNTRSLNSEIDFFKRNNDVIDLLFISHLDYDHVSGVKRLLKEFDVKNIIIPYFPKELRGYSLLSIGIDSDDDNGGLLNESDYFDFINDPYTFLKEQGGEDVNLYIIKSDENSSDNLEYGNYSQDLTQELHPIGSLSQDENINSDLDGLNALVYKNNLQFFGGNIWEFTTYVKPILSKQFIGLLIDLNKLLKKDHVQHIGMDQIKKLITEFRAQSRRLYKKHLNDINAHGMLLFHGPRNFNTIKVWHTWTDEIMFKKYERRGYNYLRRLILELLLGRAKPNFIAELLMGDTSLTGDHAISFPRSLWSKLNSVHLFQIPHHGSDKNWDENVYNGLNLGMHFKRNEVINVCNFGFGNNYGHPGARILKDLKGKIILNSQFHRFNTHYRINHK